MKTNGAGTGARSLFLRRFLFVGLVLILIGGRLEAKPRYSKLAFEVSQFCEIERPDYVDHGQRLWFCGEHRKPLDDASLAHDDYVEASLFLASDICDALPSGS